MATGRAPRQWPSCSTATPTTSPRSHHSSFSRSWPDSRRDISSRLATSRLRRLPASWMSAASCVRVGAWPPICGSSRLLAAPVIVAMGVRSSWEMELSSVVKRRSDSWSMVVCSAASSSNSRSIDRAIWLAKVSSSSDSLKGSAAPGVRRPQYAHRAVGGVQGQELGVGQRQGIGKAAGDPAILEAPHGDAVPLVVNRQRASRVGFAAEFWPFGQQDGHLGVKRAAYLSYRHAQHVIHVHRRGRLMGQSVERRGALGIVAGQPLLAAQPGRHIADEDGDGEVEEEKNYVLGLGNLQGKTRFNEQEVPGDGAD